MSKTVKYNTVDFEIEYLPCRNIIDIFLYSNFHLSFTYVSYLMTILLINSALLLSWLLPLEKKQCCRRLFNARYMTCLMIFIYCDSEGEFQGFRNVMILKNMKVMSSFKTMIWSDYIAVLRCEWITRIRQFKSNLSSHNMYFDSQH